MLIDNLILEIKFFLVFQLTNNGVFIVVKGRFEKVTIQSIVFELKNKICMKFRGISIYQ